jgi:hypothetical protein
MLPFSFDDSSITVGSIPLKNSITRVVPVKEAVGHPLKGSLLGELVEMRDGRDPGHWIPVSPSVTW